MSAKKMLHVKKIIWVSVLALACVFGCTFLADLASKLQVRFQVFADENVQWQVQHYQQKTVFGEIFDEEDYDLFEVDIFTSEANTLETATEKTYDGFQFNSEVSVKSATISADGTTIIKLFYDRLKFNISVAADEGFGDVFINQENISAATILFGEQVDISFALNQHMAFLQFDAYQTEDDSNAFEILSSPFSMPAFNLTVNLKSELERFDILIYKVFYENKTNFQTQLFTTLHVPYGGTDSILVPQNTNYHLFSVNGKTFSSTNNNITFDGELLEISNALACDEVYIYYEKDFYQIVLSYGTNYSADNFLGGNAQLLNGDNIFGKSVADKITHASIYLGTDFDIAFSAKAGYRFYEVLIEDENGYSTGYDGVDCENNVLKVKNIVDNLFIRVIFLKTYVITGEIQETVLGNFEQKIAQIAFDEETLRYENISRIIDEGFSIEIHVVVDEQFSRVYEFKKWVITYDDGNEIDYENFMINQQTNKQENSAKIVVSEIYSNLTITAVFGKKNVSVAISWNGLYGTIQTEAEGDEDVYQIEFGDNINFTLSAQDDMHFLKSLEMVAPQGMIAGENVFRKIYEVIEKDDNASILPSQGGTNNSKTGDAEEIKPKVVGFSISNVTENLVVKLKFVSDTWWEHIKIHGFYGNGTEGIPYMIRNAEDLSLLSYYIANNIKADPSTIDYDKAYYILAADIDCGHDYFYVPIGTDAHPFNGVFNYNFHAIQNMYIENQNLEYLCGGVFYKIGSNGKIVNQYRTYTLLIVTFALVAVIIIATVLIVLVIEKKVKPPQRIITIKQYLARKGADGLQQFDLSKMSAALHKKGTDSAMQENAEQSDSSMENIDDGPETTSSNTGDQ